jgi:hypothetical protein
MRIGDRTGSPSVTRALCPHREQTKARGNAAVVAPTCRQLGQVTKSIIWALLLTVSGESVSGCPKPWRPLHTSRLVNGEKDPEQSTRLGVR